jgi:putative MFS transporter
MTLQSAFNFSLVMSIGAPLGAILAAISADKLGRKPTVALACIVAIIVGYLYPGVKDPMVLPLVGMALTTAIFVLYALLFGIYIPEMFPTEVRLRAAGVCNTFGRGMTIVTPFIVIALFDTNGVAGVVWAMSVMLSVLAVVVVAFGLEPRRRSLEDMTSGVASKDKTAVEGA